MKFTASLASQMYKLGVEGFDDIALIPATSSVGAFWARNQCIRIMRMIEKDRREGKMYDWTVWFDSDMIYPDRTIQALIRHDKPIVGATYRRRSPPHEMLGRPLTGQTGTYAVGTLAPAARLPTGVLLVRRDVFEHLPMPIWRVNVGDQDGVNGVEGEDSLFCDAAIAAGFEIWLDTQLTAMVKHVVETELEAEVEDIKPSPIILPGGLHA